MKYCMECGHGMETAAVEGKERWRCPACGWVYWEDPKVVVAVIIARDGCVLLGRRGPPGVLGAGLWSFPAGFVDRGERLEDAGAREVREETGLHVQLGRLLMLRSEPDSPVILAVYPACKVEGTPAPGAELTELGWFSHENVPELAFGHDSEVLAAWWNEQHTSFTAEITERTGRVGSDERA